MDRQIQTHKETNTVCV